MDVIGRSKLFREGDDEPFGGFLFLWLWGVLACGLPLAVYLRTLAPTVYGIDSAELTTGAYVLGIVHAPGSPLYLLLAHLFTWLPVGDVGYRVNLMSACAAAVTLLFIYHILQHLTGHRFISLTASWYLGFTYYFWISALAAELYALQGTFVAGLLLLALKWRTQSHSCQLYALTFLFGLGSGNHLSLVLLAPGFAILLLSANSQPWRRPRMLLTAVAFGLLGASVYLYLPLRYASDTPLDYARYAQVDLTTWRGFWWMVTGRMFGSLFFSVPLSELPTELLVYLHRLWSNFVGLGCLLGLLGVVSDFKRRPSLHTALLIMFFSHLAFYLTYGVGDKELMFLPTYLIWGIWLGIGTTFLVKWLTEQTKNSYDALGPTLLAMMAFGCLILNFRYVDISQDWSAREFGEAILAELEPQAVYLGRWKEVPILEYLQIVEGKRSDVTVLNLLFIGEPGGQQMVYETLAAGLPVYTSSHSWLETEYLAFEYIDGCECYQIIQTQ